MLSDERLAEIREATAFLRAQKPVVGREWVVSITNAAALVGYLEELLGAVDEARELVRKAVALAIEKGDAIIGGLAAEYDADRKRLEQQRDEARVRARDWQESSGLNAERALAAEAQLVETKALIEAIDASAASEADESGEARVYLIPAGHWHRLLGWARGGDVRALLADGE